MIKTSLKENYQVTQTNGKHTITSDVGTDIGGEDSALNPHELLEASLGSCTTITVMMYARRKGIELEDVITTVKVVAENNEINEISRDIELKGHLAPEIQTRLIEIADKCPMHKFLSKRSVITTRLV